MSYAHEVEIPFDVLKLDDYTYVVPHGIRVDTETLVKAGVDTISLINRNVTVGPPDHDEVASFDSHPLFPADEFLLVKGVDSVLTRFSNKLLQILGMTIEVIFDYFSESNQQILNIDPSQLSISRGRLIIGEVPAEQMNIVWTGADFVVVPASSKLMPPEETVVEIEGSITGSQFRCKYGLVNILRR